MAIDGGAAAFVVLGDVRGHALAPHLSDEVGRVVGLVSTQRDAAAVGHVSDHRLGRLTLGGAGGERRGGAHHQAVAVLHDYVAHVAQLRSLPCCLLIEPGIRIGGRGVRLVAPLLTMKVALAIASIGRWLATAVLRPEALHRRPGFDQRAVDREVLVRKQRLDLWVSQQGLQKPASDVAFQQPVTVLGEHRHIPYRRVHRQADEPAEHHVVGELLHQLALRAHREECLEQQGSQQLLRWDRGTADLRVKLIERRGQATQGGVHERTNHSQRMVRRHHRLRAQVAEYLTRLTIRPAHPQHPRSRYDWRESDRCRPDKGFFRILLVSVRKGIKFFESVTGGAFNLLNLFVSDEFAGQEYLRWTYVEPEESRQA